MNIFEMREFFMNNNNNIIVYKKMNIDLLIINK